MKKYNKLFTVFALAIIASMFTGCVGKVDSNEVGFKTQWGKVDPDLLKPGLYFVNPIGGSLITYDTRVAKSEIKAPTFTKDMQTADLQLVVTYAPDKARVVELHTEYGRKEWAQKIVMPVVTGVAKDVIGQWEADTLVNGREQATAEINRVVRERLQDKPVHFHELIIANIDFSDAFESAIEAKQIATQEAIKAKNRTVQIEEESRQDVIRAEAKAKAKAEAEAKLAEAQKAIAAADAAREAGLEF